MQENPDSGRNIKLLTVRIHVANLNEQGSGIIYLPKNQDDCVYILTAKHCICGIDFDFQPEAKDLSFEIFNYKKQSYITFQDIECNILFFDDNDKDIAIIVIPLSELAINKENFPSLNLLEDSRGVRNSAIFGFPSGSHDQSLERFDTILQLPTENNTWKAELQRAVEVEEFDSVQSSMKGFSGSGFLLNTQKELYLYGIVTDFIEWKRFLGVKVNLINPLLIEFNISSEPIIEIETNHEIEKAITFLSRNSEIICSNIQRKSSLGEQKLFLERKTLHENIISLVSSKKVVIVNGNAGYGKSVIAVNTLLQASNEFSVWALKAEQITTKSIDEILLENGSTARFSEVLDSPLLLNQKIILVDSTERLLETQVYDGLEALMELVSIRKDLKVIFTIRDYALGFLLSFPKDDYGSIEVPSMSEEEMKFVVKAYPDLKLLLSNDKISQILYIPFYLNYIIQQLPNLNVNENLDEKALKVILWKNIIEKTNKDRGSLFENLSLRRANEMSFYVSMEDTSMKDLGSLINDEIVMSFDDDYDNTYYAPTHDIFEDWALVRYISRKRREFGSDLTRFYDTVGNALAIRRGFRFWLNQELNESDTSKIFTDFISPSLNLTKLSEYWKEEILVSILLSDHCTYFLNQNSQAVLKNNSFLLLRLIHLLRTACRKPYKSIVLESANDKETKLYSFNFEPIGSSWASIISFIYSNNTFIEERPILVLSLLLAWAKKLNLVFFVPEESRMVGELLLRILSRKKIKRIEGLALAEDDILDKGLTLLLRLTEVMKDEVKSILLDSIDLSREKEIYHSQSHTLFSNNEDPGKLPKSDNLLIENFHKKIIELALSYSAARELCYFLPDLVIRLANEKWFLNNQVTNDRYSILGIEESFGLNGRFASNYNPASAYQTPMFFLLHYHPHKALSFLINIINNCTISYKDSDFGLRNDVKENYIVLNNGKKILKWSNITLWTMYRNLSIGTGTPELLKSILMALEKWMLNLGDSKETENHETLILAVKLIQSKSISAMTTSIISSISMAFPFLLKEKLIPIFTVPEFFFLDRMRCLYRERIYTLYIPGKQHLREERLESFNREHRKDHLEIFLLKLSFYEGFQEQIYSILDRYIETAGDHKEWLLMLNRMDRRLYEFEQNTDNKNQVIMSPVLKENLKSYVEEGERQRESDRPRNEISVWAIDILDKNDQVKNTFENWKKYYQYYIKHSEEVKILFLSFSDKCAVAYIGLEYHLNKLDIDQLDWCIQTVMDTANKLVEADMDDDPFNMEIGTFDEKSVIHALPLMINDNMDKAAQEFAKFHIVLSINRLSLQNGIQEPLFRHITCKLWEVNHEFANQCFRAIYELSFLEMPDGYHFGNGEYEEKIKRFKQKEKEIIEKAVRNELKEITHPKIELSRTKAYYLDKLFNFLPEKNELTKELETFRIKYEKELIFETYIDETENYWNNGRDLISNNMSYQEKYARLLYFQNVSFHENALEITLNYVFNPEKNNSISRKTIELTSEIFSYIIDLENNNSHTEHFWSIWHTIYDLSMKNDSIYFSSNLLFSSRINRLSHLSDWKPFETKIDFVKQIILNFGEYNIEDVVRLLGGPGGEHLLPSGILWLKELIHKRGMDRISDLFYYERLVQRAYFDHRKELQENSELLRAYIYLLDILVAAGSSSSFYLREISMSSYK